MSVSKMQFFVGLKAGKEESGKVDWKSMSKDKVAALSQMFCEVGTKAGWAAGMSVGKLTIAKVQVKMGLGLSAETKMPKWSQDTFYLLGQTCF